VVPWGAAIRDNGGIIEYQVGSTWKAASGRFGSVTNAILRFSARSHRRLGLLRADELARAMFFSGTTLITRWNKNDFGKWSWNLKRDGHRTPYFIHTTPGDEAATAAATAFEMEQSHGCVHIRPRDRDEMMAAGALREGVEVRVMPYGDVGPP
jgi:hypothetical protein